MTKFWRELGGGFEIVCEPRDLGRDRRRRGMSAEPIEHEHVTNPRAYVGPTTRLRVSEQTRLYLDLMGAEATRRQLKARAAELAERKRPRRDFPA